MATTTRTSRQQILGDTPPLRWQRWPFAECAPWSWLSILALLATGVCIYVAGGGWLLAIAAPIGLAATLWQFFLPIEYEVASLGLRRRVLGRAQLLPWHAIRAYHPRTGGLVMFQHSEPSSIDLLRSIYIPYPSNKDELLSVVRQYLSHASELPKA